MSRQAVFPDDPFTPETSGLIASSPASFVLAYRPSCRARRLICIIYATGWNFTDKVPSIRLTPIRCHATKGQRGYGRLRPGRITSGASTPALRSLKRSLAFLERHDVRRLSSSANVLEQRLLRCAAFGARGLRQWLTSPSIPRGAPPGFPPRGTGSRRTKRQRPAGEEGR